MNPTELNGQLYGLYSLKGTVSEGRLLKAGFSKSAIGKAVSSNGLARVGEGFYRTNPQISRRLFKTVEAELSPGQKVYHYKDGRIKTSQVVMDQGSKVTLVNPEEKTVDDADEKEIMTQDQIDELRD